MKKWITIDDIICSFVSSVAYGFGLYFLYSFTEQLFVY